MKKKFSFAAAILLLAYANVVFSQTNMSQRLLPQVKNSVFTVYAEDEQGFNFSIGSGFFISRDGIGITNFHVLEGAYGGYIKDVKGRTFKIKEILDYSPNIDLVKFSIEKDGSQQMVPLTVSRQSPKQGEEIMSYSTPLGVFENTISTGIVSSVRTMKGYGSVVQITAPISHGSSGSPIINSSGNVVGIATFGYDAGQSLNFAVDAIQLQKLTRSLHIPIGEMRRNELETARIKLAKRYGESNEFKNAITFLDKEIEINPNNDLAFYYRGLYKCRDNQYQTGLSDLETACRLDTTNVTYYVKMGTFLRNVAIMQWEYSHEVNGNLINLAEYVVSHSLSLDPNRGEPLADYGYILYYAAHQKDGNLNIELLHRAKELLDIAVSVAPIAEIYSIRGEINAGLKNLGEALLDYDKVISLSPKNYRGYQMRGDIRIFEFNQIDEGLLDLERAYTLAQKNYEKADCLGLKASALEKKAFQLPPNASEYILKAIKSYDAAYNLTNNSNYVNLRNKMINRVKAYIRINGEFPGGLKLAQ